MQGCSSKKYRNKVEIKTQKPNLTQNNGREERQEEYPSYCMFHVLGGDWKNIGYCSCLNDSVCRVLFLPLYTTIVLYKVSLLCFDLYLVSVLFTATSLHEIDFLLKNFLP